MAREAKRRKRSGRDWLADGLILLALGLFGVPGLWNQPVLAQEQAGRAAEAAETEEEPEPGNALTLSRALLEKLDQAQKQNSQVVGWLWVPGAEVDLPVLQSPGDNEYYLRRNLAGEYDSRGSLFLDERCDGAGGTVDRLIYGHEMGDGSMFGQLKNYRDPACFERWPTLAYATGEGVELCRVLAVFEARVLNQGEEGFRYYYFFDAPTREEWEEWYWNIRELALYDTGVTGTWEDRYFTLSTCDSSRPGGRFALVAKREEYIPAPAPGKDG